MTDVGVTLIGIAVAGGIFGPLGLLILLTFWDALKPDKRLDRPFPDELAWRQMPTMAGVWFFTANIEHWRNPIIAHVQRVQEPDGTVVFDVVTSTVRNTVTPEMGWWYGPLPFVRPSKEVLP